MADKNDPECHLDFSNVSHHDLKNVADRLAGFFYQDISALPSPVSVTRRPGKADLLPEGQSKIEPGTETVECVVIPFPGCSRFY